MPRFYDSNGDPVDPADVLLEDELVEYERRRKEDIRKGRIKFTGWVSNREGS